MKTKFKFASLFALLLTLLSFAPKNVNAQCATLDNNLQCQVTVKIDIYEIDPILLTCSQLCTSYVIPNINPNQIVPINCGACAQCNIAVTILTVGGMSASGYADYNVFPSSPGSVTGGATGCVSGTSQIYYIPTGTRFRITR